MRPFLIHLPVIVVILLLAAAGCVGPSPAPVAGPVTTATPAATQTNAPVPSGTTAPAATAAAPATAQEIKDFVDKAAAYAQENGRVAALAAFSNPTGPYVRGDVYIYALDYSGRALALPFQPELVGTDFAGKQDHSGRYYTKTEILLAKDQGGFLLYEYPDPSRNFTPRYKVSYVRPVDDTYWIGAGIYTSEDRLVDRELRDFVREAKTYGITHSREQALAEFNKVNGSFVRGELYVFAYDFNGTVIAWPYRPDQIGVNRNDATDLTGTHHVRAMADAARSGAGMVEYYSVNPATNTTQLKISYIMDVDGEWFLGAGRYLQPGPVILRD